MEPCHVPPRLSLARRHAVPAKRKTPPTTDPAADVPTVLLVQEDVLVRMVVADYLRSCRYRVYEVATTDEALAVLGTHLAVDTVFTGVHAAGSVDGFGLAQWVRQRRPGTKVVLSAGVRRTAQIAGELCEENPPVARRHSVREIERRIRSLLAR